MLGLEIGADPDRFSSDLKTWPVAGGVCASQRNLPVFKTPLERFVAPTEDDTTYDCSKVNPLC
jgi:hypothetical protein